MTASIPARRVLTILTFTVLVTLTSPVAVGTDALQLDPRSRVHPVRSNGGMVVAQESIAAEIGAAILQEGGNAVDAAVATGFALAVTLPQAGNLGGGGFMLIHLAESGESLALDYRETAPAAAEPNMFLDPDGEVDPALSRDSLLSSGVPGTVAGFYEALTHYGTLSWEEVIAPAIRLAETGFPVYPALSSDLASAADRLMRSAESRRLFFHHDGRPRQPGEVLRQAELGKSLRSIAEEGPSAFYEGWIATAIATEMRSNGGAITESDLRDYRAVWRDPVAGVYRGYQIYSMPPPSSGGVHLVQMLNLLEHFPVADSGFGSATTIHLQTEIMKRAYADRSVFLGDPDFVPVPVAGITARGYAESLLKKINLARATPASEISEGNPHRFTESPQTTHYSVVDRHGNAVSNTYTLNFSFGNGHIVPGTGVLMNNEMDDFSAKPGVPNAYGLIGGRFNAIEPGKRMLSSMTPTIVLKDAEVFLVTGSPGGSRIITTTLQILLNVIDHGMNIAEATLAPRMHHQWLPDTTYLERGFSPDTLRKLEKLGHVITPSNAMGSTQSILRRDGLLFGASDPRRPGGAAVAAPLEEGQLPPDRP